MHHKAAALLASAFACAILAHTAGAQIQNPSHTQPPTKPADAAPASRGGPGYGGRDILAEPPAWVDSEAPTLINHTQLTFPDRFLKAGEAYFSPDGSRIIFQAVERPQANPQGEASEPEPFYAMFVADLTREDGKPPRLTNITRISPPGTANTCGWFHPTNPASVIYGSTLVWPADDEKSGFQVGTRNYRWQFPREMEIVTQYLVNGTTTPAANPAPVFNRDNYDAECSLSPDGRFLLYAHVEDTKEGERADVNIYIRDLKTGTDHAIVTAPGYDGGPFFSPDGQWICFRSDRKGNDRLQLFVARLKLEDGVPTGIEAEYQLTDNEHVNWAPFWHPSGNFLIYGTSQIGGRDHSNYELFAIEVDRDALTSGARAARDMQQRRITVAGGADILPAFSADGKHLMWTSQRGPKREGEERATTQLWIADFSATPPQLFRKAAP